MVDTSLGTVALFERPFTMRMRVLRVKPAHCFTWRCPYGEHTVERSTFV